MEVESMLTRIALTVLAACGALQSAAAQDFFDFGQIPGVAEPTVQIDLDPWLLGFVGEAARFEDPAAADLLAGLQGIRVRVYEELEDAVAVGGFIDSASQALESDGWQRMVYVQDGSDKVRIYVRRADELLLGMTVMVVDATEAVFISMAGSISPAQLGQVANALGIGEALEGLGAAGGAIPVSAEPAD
jgi:hypothetical protein